MNIFHKVTLQTLKKNRIRTLVTIIGIILSAAMICAVTTFASSYINFMAEDAIYNKGNFYGSGIEITADKIEEVKDDDRLSSLSICQNIGYAKLTGCINAFKPYLYIMGADSQFLKSMPVHLTSGRLPQTSSEVLIPSHVKTNGGVDFSIGDTLTLDVGQRKSDGYTLYQNTALVTGEGGSGVYESLESTNPCTYTVVGFYERPSFENYSAPGYTVITLMDESLTDTSSYNIYFKTKSSGDIYDFMADYGFKGNTNWKLLAYSGTSRYQGFYSVMYGFATILIGLIMFGSISLIYNAFAISVSERTKQFGLLISVGATKRQIRGSVVYEAMVLSLIGIPIGVLSGIGGIGVTLYLLGDKLSSLTGSQVPITVSVSWVSVATAVVVAIITVLISALIPSKRAVKISAIDAIRQNQDVTADAREVRTSNVTYKLFGLEGMIANKYFKRSKRRYKATIVSLFMSIVLFISASSFCLYLTESVSGTMDTYGYDIVYNCSSKAEALDFKNLYKQLSSVNGVKKSAYADLRTINLQLSAESYTKNYLQFIEYAYGKEALDQITNGIETRQSDVYFIEDSYYKSFLKENKLDVDKYMSSTKPVALVYDSIQEVNNGKFYNLNVLSSNADIWMFEPKEVEGYYYSHSELAQDGSKVVVYVSNTSSDAKQLPYEDYSVTTKLSAGEKTHTLPFCASNNRSMLILLYPYSAISTVIRDNSLPNVGMYFTCSNHNKTYESMKKLLEEKTAGSSSNLTDYASRADEKRNIVTVISVFAYGFIVLISLIALANVFNTITTNIALRRREFAMLRSVGMTSRGFNKMMSFECVMYGFKALITGLPVSVLVTILIYYVTNSGYTTGFHMSWKAIVIAVFSVFAVVFTTMMYAMKKIKKDNPVDSLRNENL